MPNFSNETTKKDDEKNQLYRNIPSQSADVAELANVYVVDPRDLGSNLSTDRNYLLCLGRI